MKNRKWQIQLAFLSYGIIIGGIAWILWETFPHVSEKPVKTEAPSPVAIKEAISLPDDSKQVAKQEAPPPVAIQKEISLPDEAEQPAKTETSLQVAVQKEASLPDEAEQLAKTETPPPVAIKKETSIPTFARQEPSAAETVSDEIADVAPLANVCQEVHLNWRQGEKRMYAFKQTLDLETNLNLLVGKFGDQNQFLKQEVINEGVLNLAIFEVDAETALLGFQYTPRIFSINGNRLLLVEELLSTFFFARFHQTGRPLEFFFPEEFSGQDQTIVAELIRAIQVVIPEDYDPVSASWTLEEENSSGRYEAQYYLNGTECVSFNKEKIQYFSVNEIIKGAFDNTVGGFEKTILHSQFKGEIDSNHSWLKRMEGSEFSETLYQGNLVSRENQNIVLEEIPFEPDPDLEIWQENRDVAQLVQSFDKYSDPQKTSRGFWERQNAEALREHFKDVTLDMLLEALSRLIQGQAHWKQVHALKAKLRDFLVAFPNEALQLPGYLKQFVIDDADGYHGSVITDALSNAGHEEAQQALVHIMADGAQQPQHRLTAIINSGFLDDPQPFVIDQLQSLVQFQHETHNPDQWVRSSDSLLALGVGAFFLKQNHNELAKDSVAFIHGFLDKANTDSEKAIAISALANARDEELLPLLHPFLNHENKIIREKAIRAFRYYPSEEATRILEQNFEQNSFRKVRQEAFEALTERSTPEIVEKVHQRLPSEKAENLRIAMIRYLGEHLNSHPKIEETLKRQLQKPTSKTEMKAIYEAIARKKTVQNEDNGKQ